MGRRTPHRLNRNSEFYDRYGRLKDGFSYEGGAGMVARGTVETNVSSGAGKDGLSYKKGSRTVYSREAKPASAPAPKPAPKPKPKPKPKAPPKEPIKYSPEIEQAKDRVNAYENGKSPWEQAQANVQSSFIKDTDANSNNQYDFSGNTFDANQSSKPNEQAQAAQNQMQNYISKYSQFKSST